MTGKIEPAKLSHEVWAALAAQIADESIVIDAADMMIPSNEIRARIVHWRAAGNDQRIMNAERAAGNVLIALEKLGYRVVKI